MPSVFQTSILTQEKKLYEGNVTSIIVPSSEGYAGFLARHAPFMATLSAGKIVLRDETGKEQTFEVREKGFFQMKGNRVTALIL